MLRWVCVILVGLIVAASVLEYVAGLTPLEQVTALAKREMPLTPGNQKQTVIRIGIAGWQFDEFPWAQTIARYEADHPGVKVQIMTVPDGNVNTMLLVWAQGTTPYDVVVAWSNVDMFPLIEYNWNSLDSARRSLVINVADYLTPEQLATFIPSAFSGVDRKDPQTGKMNLYEIPWLGEVLALNYNKEFFRQRNLAVPKTWAEVEQACQKLSGLEYKGQKVAPLAMNLAQTGFFVQNAYIPLLAEYKGGRGIADEKGHLDVSSPEAAKTFGTLKRWYDAGYISNNCMVMESVEQDLRVLRAAMYAHWQSRGLWALKDHGPNVIGIAPTPGATEVGSLIASYGCVIPKCSPVVRQAVDFAYETFCTDKYGFATAVTNGWIDKTTGLPKGGGKMPVLRAMYQRKDLLAGIVELQPAMEKGYAIPDPTNYAQYSDIVVVEFQRYLSGRYKTAEEALAVAQHRLAEEVYGGQ